MNDYIRENVNKNKDKFEALNESYQEIRNKEEELKNYMAKIQEQEDLDYEVFSPRNGDSSSKSRVTECEKKLKLVKAKRETLRAQMNQILSDNVELEKLNDDGLHNKKIKVDESLLDIGEGKYIKYKDIEKMVSKVKLCMKLVDSDPDNCITELKNLIYVLKHI